MARNQAPHSDGSYWEAVNLRGVPRDDLGVRRQCVRGSVSEFLVDTTIPGGARLPTGDHTLGVRPTHRRQGIGRQPMERLVVEASGRGCSPRCGRPEATIYPRFGFGVAGENASAVIDSRRSRPLRWPRSRVHSAFSTAARSSTSSPPSMNASPTGGRARITRPDDCGPLPRDGHRRLGGIVRRRAPRHQRLSRRVRALRRHGTTSSRRHRPGTAGSASSRRRRRGIELAMWRYLLDIDLVTI